MCQFTTAVKWRDLRDKLQIGKAGRPLGPSRAGGTGRAGGTSGASSSGGASRTGVASGAGCPLETSSTNGAGFTLGPRRSSSPCCPDVSFQPPDSCLARLPLQATWTCGSLKPRLSSKSYGSLWTRGTGFTLRTDFALRTRRSFRTRRTLASLTGNGNE